MLDCWRSCLLRSPSALPFGFLCVCQCEPKILFSGSEESWKQGLNTQVCGQPNPGAPCCFATEHREMGAGSWLLSGHGAAMVSRQLRDQAGLQLPKQQMQPLPGCQILVSHGGWSHGHLSAGPVAIAFWRPTDTSPSGSCFSAYLRPSLHQ